MPHSALARGQRQLKSLTEQLARYAAYHRDRRNIATHFIGIPMIVLSLAIMLSRPASTLDSLPFAVSPAWLLFVGATIYYLRLDVTLGLAMAAISAMCLAFGEWSAQTPTTIRLSCGIALFVIGWIFQFVGHAAYEHKKPAFADDMIGLAIGPLFVLAEALFVLGWRPELRKEIERQCGPTVSRQPRPSATEGCAAAGTCRPKRVRSACSSVKSSSLVDLLIRHPFNSSAKRRARASDPNACCDSQCLISNGDVIILLQHFRLSAARNGQNASPPPALR
jgi:uncharacterized membrane protein YGL010W